MKLSIQLATSIALLAAAATLANNDRTDAIPWGELHPSSKKFFTDEAEHFIAIDGSLWSREVVNRYDRIARVQKTLAPAWTQDDAPLLYNLATGDRHGPWGRPDERVISYDAVILQFQARRNEESGIVPLQGKVTRTMSDGALIDLGRRTVFVDGVEGATVGQEIVAWGKRHGYHYYVDSSRTRRTIDRYVSAEPNLAVVEEKVTGEELYEYCIAHQIDGITFFVPERIRGGEGFTWRETKRWTRIVKQR